MNATKAYATSAKYSSKNEDNFQILLQAAPYLKEVYRLIDRATKRGEYSISLGPVYSHLDTYALCACPQVNLTDDQLKQLKAQIVTRLHIDGYIVRTFWPFSPTVRWDKRIIPSAALNV